MRRHKKYWVASEINDDMRAVCCYLHGVGWWVRRLDIGCYFTKLSHSKTGRNAINQAACSRSHARGVASRPRMRPTP
jgi:hypothetical protein